MRDALVAAFLAQIIVIGSIILTADVIVNRQTMYAVVFGVVR